MTLCIRWSHGQESGPWGSKIRALAEAAQKLGHDVDSVDYRGMADPEDRARKLVDHCRGIEGDLVLAGSSLGGFVSLRAAEKLPVKGLFLLAPAIRPSVWDSKPQGPETVRIVIVHGWRDDIIPPRNSVDFAEQRGALLHLVDGDHRLRENIEELKVYQKLFLDSLI